jgi:hypothetical protein
MRRWFFITELSLNEMLMLFLHVFTLYRDCLRPATLRSYHDYDEMAAIGNVQALL